VIRRLRSRVSCPFAAAAFLSLGILSAAATALGYSERKNQWDVFYQSTPLGYTPGRTAVVAETTIRHQVYFSDLEAGTTGWSMVNHRAGMPLGWNIVSGSHACTGNSWWCGLTGLPRGDGYGNAWIQTLTTNVPINIGGFSNTKVTFKMRHQSEWSYDYGWVLIKSGAAGAHWDTLASYTGDFGSSCGNQSLAIPAAFNAATQPITLMFLFGSDMEVSAEDSTGAFTGWTLDDIAVTSGATTHFFDNMEAGSSKWVASSPNPGLLWHLENSPGTSQPATCFFLNTNVWVPFQGSGFGVVPDFADQMIMSPPMDLAGVFSPATPTTSLKLQFDQWINLPPANDVYWSLWISGSTNKTTWTPWRNALGALSIAGGPSPQCYEGVTYDFNPYDSTRTGFGADKRYIRLGIRLRDEKAIDGPEGVVGDGAGPLRLGYMTEGMYVDNLGVFYVYTISGVETVSGVPVASRPRIQKSFPNPFNPMTTIEFSVPKSGPVRVGIFDIHGRSVAALVDEAMGPGVYRVRWNGKDTNGADVASGVYYAQIRSRGGSGSGRLALIK
jgi:hypothetical protein